MFLKNWLNNRNRLSTHQIQKLEDWGTEDGKLGIYHVADVVDAIVGPPMGPFDGTDIGRRQGLRGLSHQADIEIFQDAIVDLQKAMVGKLPHMAMVLVWGIGLAAEISLTSHLFRDLSYPPMERTVNAIMTTMALIGVSGWAVTATKEPSSWQKKVVSYGLFGLFAAAVIVLRVSHAMALGRAVGVGTYVAMGVVTAFSVIIPPLLLKSMAPDHREHRKQRVELRFYQRLLRMFRKEQTQSRKQVMEESRQARFHEAQRIQAAAIYNGANRRAQAKRIQSNQGQAAMPSPTAIQQTIPVGGKGHG